tara:strand:+ start:7831 stop:8583 length:753 start_codon:yes stop_codon:yes gene_type:complete
MYRNAFRQQKINAWVDLSTLCNAKCPQCHRTNPNGLDKQEWLPLVQWTLLDFKKAFPIQTLKHIQRFEICGTWGDPIANKDIDKIVEYIINHSNSEIIINTNGSLRSRNWWYKLGMIGKKRLSIFFAIEGIDQEMHSAYRVNTDLRKILDNMLEFGKHSIVKVFVVVFDHNEDYLEEIYQMCELYNSKETLFFPSNRFGPHPDFDYVYKNKQLKLKPVRSMDSPFYRPEDAYKWKINLTGKHKKDMHLKL